MKLTVQVSKYNLNYNILNKKTIFFLKDRFN